MTTNFLVAMKGPISSVEHNAAILSPTVQGKRKRKTQLLSRPGYVDWRELLKRKSDRGNSSLTVLSLHVPQIL